jgi:hypothetical protein
MKLVPLNAIFDIEYGNQFDLNKMEVKKKGINFVSRSSKSLGVVAQVEKIQGVEPYPRGLITVTLGGTYLLSSFVQQENFYTAQNIKVLIPKRKMGFVEKIFYCLVISKNRFRYSSHGREANTSLDNLLVPSSIPIDWNKISFEEYNMSKEPLLDRKIKLNTFKWSYFDLDDLFEVSASKDELINDLTIGGKTPYVTSSSADNGITAHVKEQATNPEKTITANRGGSVGFFYYQPTPYKATPVDVRILTPKFKMNAYMGLFLKTILQLEKYRFNYSRKMGTERLKELKIKLPSKNNRPDWSFMENYIKSLAYSKNI